MNRPCYAINKVLNVKALLPLFTRNRKVYPSDEVPPVTASSNVHWGPLKLHKLYLPFHIPTLEQDRYKGNPPWQGMHKGPTEQQIKFYYKIKLTRIDMKQKT